MAIIYLKKRTIPIEVTPEMVGAGKAAYAAWCTFADDPLAARSRLTRAVWTRLDEGAMVREVIRAVFGNAVRLPDA